MKKYVIVHKNNRYFLYSSPGIVGGFINFLEADANVLLFPLFPLAIIYLIYLRLFKYFDYIDSMWNFIDCSKNIDQIIALKLRREEEDKSDEGQVYRL